MQNVEMKVAGTKLMITVDLTKTFGDSKTGKTVIIASTQGNQPVGDGENAVCVGLNVYRKK